MPISRQPGYAHNKGPASHARVTTGLPPVGTGLTVGGEHGISRVLDIFNEELVTVMQLSGVNDVNAIPATTIRDREARR